MSSGEDRADSEAPDDGFGGTAHEAASEGASVEYLHATYRDRLRRYFLKHVGDHPDVEDLIQQTFLRLAKPDRLAGVDNVEAYVFRTAGNLLIERNRAAGRRHEKAHIPLPIHAIDDGVFSPERIFEGKEDLARTVQALNELPARTRAIFMLQRFEGYSYTELAKRLGVTPSAIDKQMSRAIAHLAKRMKDIT